MVFMVFWFSWSVTPFSWFFVVLTFHLPSNLFAARGEGGAANKLEGKWKVSLCLVAPSQAAAVYNTNSSICRRATFEDICAVTNVTVRVTKMSG